jgi:glycosyltransferase involved in cell wall biosynthesis
LILTVTSAISSDGGPGTAPRRILVVTADVLGDRMAGPAIRAHQIAGALADEHDVQLVTFSSSSTLASDRFTTRSVTPEDIDGLIGWAEILIVQGYVLHTAPKLAASDKIMVVDLYDPLHLESLELTRGWDPAIRLEHVAHTQRVLTEQLQRGDFFLCASTKQRDLWIGYLSALGRINPSVYDADPTLRSLVAVVPFGLSETPPVATAPGIKGVIEGIAPDDEVILWGGGIYDWFDPLTLLHAVDKLRARRPGVRLVFMGMRHPNPGVSEMRMSQAARTVSDQLGLTDKVVFFHEGWVPFNERQNFLVDADVSVTTHLDHAETAFAFRTRVLDALWARTPIVSTTGDVFAELIEREQLGLTVAPGDIDALEEALFSVLDDKVRAATYRSNIAAVATRFTWPVALAPLMAFCRKPGASPDRAERASVPVTPPVLEPPPRRGDLAIALDHLRHGGPRQLLAKVFSRLGHRLAGRR